MGKGERGQGLIGQKSKKQIALFLLIFLHFWKILVINYLLIYQRKDIQGIKYCYVSFLHHDFVHILKYIKTYLLYLTNRYFKIHLFICLHWDSIRQKQPLETLLSYWPLINNGLKSPCALKSSLLNSAPTGTCCSEIMRNILQGLRLPQLQNGRFGLW